MKLSYKWLKQFVKTKYSPEEIAEKLTMAGLEVDEVISEVGFSGVFVGQVLSVDAHPNADKLHIAQIDLGHQVLQIVCGANNLAKDQLVPVATIGAVLGDFKINKAKLRGIESNGMICSEKELGLGDNHDGIMVLPSSEYKVGQKFIPPALSDSIIDVNILANRPDCMSIIGLSREVAAITNEKIDLQKVEVASSTLKEKVNVEIIDDKFCPRYLSRIIKGVKKQETPDWMKARLVASGIRSINLLVDISNYVMLEYGQPLHFFDLDKIVDQQKVNIVVRPAFEGETLVTLDGTARKLTSEMLLIANDKKAIALAGVMGGLETEITSDTQNIFIEAAVFDKASIRRTSRKLGLRSEAVARYEKGLGLATPVQAIERATQLLMDLAEADKAGVVNDTLKTPLKSKKLTLDPLKLNNFLGTNYSNSDIQKVFNSLGFTVVIKNKNNFIVTIPDWRTDICESVDLYEEVARIVGFDTIPSTLPRVDVVARSNPIFEFCNVVRKDLSAIGFMEIMTYSFEGEQEIFSTGDNLKNVFEVANPLVKEQRYLRTSLISKMLESLSSNQYLKESINFFEIAKTFHKNDQGLPLEKTFLCLGVVGGSSWPITYQEGQDFYDIKGALNHIFHHFNLENVNYKLTQKSVYKEGQSASIMFNGEMIGNIGMVNIDISSKFGLKKEVAVAEIDLEKILDLIDEEIIVSPISKFQFSSRDISFIVSKEILAEDLRHILSGSDKLLQEVEIIDIYSGKPLGANEKSLTVRLTIGSFEKTLTDEEVEGVVSICQKRVSKLGGVVRGAQK